MLPPIKSMSIKKWVPALRTKHPALCVLSQHDEAIVNNIPTLQESIMQKEPSIL